MTEMPEGSRWTGGDLEAVPNCPVCASSERSILHQGLPDRLAPQDLARWSLYRCHDCGSAWLDPRPTRDSIGRAYEGDFEYHTHQAVEAPSWVDGGARGLGRLKLALVNGEINRRFGYSIEPASPALARALPAIPGAIGRIRSLVRGLPAPRKDSRLLDVGCGNGQFIRTMLDLGWRAHGLEPDPAAAERGRAAGLEITDGGLSDGVFPPASFDAITMGHVIEHLHEPGEALRICRQMLRPGGRIWIATPNLDAAVHRTLGRIWFALEPPRHLVMFSRESLFRALKEAGFDDIMVPPPVPVASQWAFQASLDVGSNTTRDGVFRRPTGRDRLRALRCDFSTVINGRRAEELVMTAVAPRQ